MKKRITVKQILDKKSKGEKIVVLTAYDYPMARIIDQAGVDIVLVGDSLANVVLGLDSTRDVGMSEMIHHAKAVNRGVEKAMVVGDMPYDAYQIDPDMTLSNAKRFIEEAGCDAVKLEWFDRCLESTKSVVDAGIPVMGHIGLTPQTAEQLGGFKVQGRDAESAKKLVVQAVELEKAGCFSIVLECVPLQIAQKISQEISIPTIGIGAGVHCDGQVLVTYDILGLLPDFKPKFVKQHADLAGTIKEAVLRFKSDVSEGRFPDEAHSFAIKGEELDKFDKNS